MKTPVVAYFSAEYAIADDMPIYAGGLGILAADVVLEAAAQNLEFYALGLVYHQAFTGDDPDQRPMTERLLANGYQLLTCETGERQLVSVPIGEREVTLQAWTKAWGRTRLLLLDACINENDPADRAISDHLYASDLKLQLAQEICLGFGGVAMLRAMHVVPDVYHLNEGHTALGGLAVGLHHLQANPGTSLAEALSAVQPSLVGTKHTILAGAGILLDWGTVEAQLSGILARYAINLDDIKALAGKSNGDYSDTKLLVNLISRGSGVSKIHVAAEEHDHPASKLTPITNGVFRWRWVSSSWNGHPLEYPDEKFWAVHCENRRQLLEHVRAHTSTTLNSDHLTVVWARRMTAYKQPGLLVDDLERLTALIHHATQPIQFIVAGQANPADTVGRELMGRIVEAARRPDLKAGLAYLPHYNPISAKLLVRGADLWLNTPIRGYEACGTSGMKASLNGAVQFSTSDGWFDEVDAGPLGWVLPEGAPAADLYDILEHQVAPLYYRRDNGVPSEWITKMRANMQLVLDNFTATRMLGEYYDQLYAPALVAEPMAKAAV